MPDNIILCCLDTSTETHYNHVQTPLVSVHYRYISGTHFTVKALYRARSFVSHCPSFTCIPALPTYCLLSQLLSELLPLSLGPSVEFGPSHQVLFYPWGWEAYLRGV